MTMVYRMKFIITHVVAIDRKSFNRLFGILLLQETNLCTYLFLVLAGDGWKVSPGAQLGGARGARPLPSLIKGGQEVHPVLQFSDS